MTTTAILNQYGSFAAALRVVQSMINSYTEILSFVSTMHLINRYRVKIEDLKELQKDIEKEQNLVSTTMKAHWETKCTLPRFITVNHEDTNILSK